MAWLLEEFVKHSFVSLETYVPFSRETTLAPNAGGFILPGCGTRIQGAGKRRWSIEEAWTSDEEERARCVEDIDLRVLADYREAQVHGRQ